MTIYSPRGHGAVTVPVERGGCGVTHTDTEGDRLKVDCPKCEAAIMRLPFGFGPSPESAALTPDEREAIEKGTRNKAELVSAMAAALAEKGSDIIASALDDSPKPRPRKRTPRPASTDAQ
ncbi:hypothetical protein [Streptomyces sp. NPDC093261]|uniref:hypothetical protein n=1 Tax=Streptomyces sp. NPDC093261 TaxID=3366037 RepID=UPI0037FA673A